VVSDPEPTEWEWTHAPTIRVVGPPSEVHTWPVLTHMAGTEVEAFAVRARQAGREWRASSARLLAARQRLWVREGRVARTLGHEWLEKGSDSIAAVQMQVDVLLVPGPDGNYLEYEVLPASNPTDQKEG
jgi:hypothetical protein